MLNKWEALNNSFNFIGDQLAIKSTSFPEVSQFSSDTDFRELSNALSALRNEIADLARETSSQTSALASDMKYFFDMSRDYDSEIEVFRKGRDQAFELYDKLSEEHRELLREYECVKADLKFIKDDIDGAKNGQTAAEESLRQVKASYDVLMEELSNLRIAGATMKKRIEILEDENAQLSEFHSHGDLDRNQLVEQLAKEIKSRNDALVLAEAARNELSRVLSESEHDRMGRGDAERARDEAVAAVDGLNGIIEQLKQEVEEQTKMCRHETLMRHKIEEALLAREEELKALDTEKQTLVSELTDANAKLSQVEDQEKVLREEKDKFTSQISVLAQQMAADKLENHDLMETLKKVQQDYEKSKIVSDDAVEKMKQLERIINQFIQDKGDLEVKISNLEKEKAQILEDSKDVVTLRTNLENKVKSLDEQLTQTKGLFEQEKKLKEEAVLGLHKAEQVIAKHDEQAAKISEELAVVSKDRGEFKSNLEAAQKILQSERLSKSELSKNFESVSIEVKKTKEILQQETQLKSQALSSLEAESRSKQEAIKQLEEARKIEEKTKLANDKSKLELENLKDRLKEEERAKKDLNKQIDDLRKEVSKGATENEKSVRAKEEATRKADAESAAHKESDKALNSEKTEHEKTYKAFMDEKSKREQFESESSNLKAQCAEAQRAAEGERVEHGKTFKAYESEKAARVQAETEVGKLKTALAEAKSSEQSLAAEKAAYEKRIAKLEATVAELAEAKDSVAKDVGSLASTKKQLEQAEKIKADVESKLAAEKQKRVELEEKIRQVKAEDEEMRIKVNQVGLENEKLVKRVARLEGELEAEKRVKDDLVNAIKKKDINDVE